MIERRRPQLPAELRYQFHFALAVLVPRHRRLEIARVGEAVRADGAEVGQSHRRPEALADVAARLTVRQLDPEAQPPGNQQHFLRCGLQDPELGRDAQPPELRHDEELAVGIVEEPIAHGAVGEVPVNAAARVRVRRAGTTERQQAIDEIGRLPRNGGWAPAQRIRRHRERLEASREPPVWQRPKGRASIAAGRRR